jgi:hypothetical protein
MSSVPSQQLCKKPSQNKHKSKKHYVSSSSDSESEKENKHVKKVENKIEKLEHKVKETKEKEKKNEVRDTKLEQKLDKLNCKLNQNEIKDKKFRLKYKTVVHRLRREKCLMVNGADAYGSFYSTSYQCIKPNEPIRLEKKINNLNLKLKSNGTGIKILREGVYTFNLTAQFDQPAQIALFVNDEPDLSTVTSNNNPVNVITVHMIVKLYECDIISFRNYLSTGDISTTMSTSGLIPCSANVELSLWRIAPIPEKHCLPPTLNENPWCYSDNESSDSEC